MGKVSQRDLTTTTTGGLFHIIIPNGLGGYVSKKISFAVIKEAVNDEENPNKGYFETEAALKSAEPVGEDGWYAIVGATDTVWTWDSGKNKWVDTTTTSVVISVNGQTGTVVLAAQDITFASGAGLSATNVRDGIDEMVAYVDAAVSGAGGTFVNQTRADSGVAVTAGENTITFSDPFLTADYSLIIGTTNGAGYEVISQTATGFVIDFLDADVINYIACSKSSTDSQFNASDVGYDNSTSGLTAENIQDAMDELSTRTGDMTKSVYDPTNVEGDAFDSANHVYDNSTSGLTADKVQDALDEINENVDTVQANSYTPLLTPVSVSVVSGTPDTVTLDCNSLIQRIFTTDTISNNLTLSLSNNTNVRVISYHFRVTGTVIMTFGGSLNWISDDADWDNSGKTYTFTGSTNSLFEISIMKITHSATDYYKLKFSGEQI